MMDKEMLEVNAFKLIEKIKDELEEVEALQSIYEIKKRVNDMIRYIEEETEENTSTLSDKIYLKVKETSRTNPELNTSLYLLYRNLIQGKISAHEAKKLYGMYLKEYKL